MDEIRMMLTIHIKKIVDLDWKVDWLKVKWNFNFCTICQSTDFPIVKKNHLEELYKLLKAYPDCGIYAMGYFKIFNNSKPIKASFLGHDNFCGIVVYFILMAKIEALLT